LVAPPTATGGRLPHGGQDGLTGQPPPRALATVVRPAGSSAPGALDVTLVQMIAWLDAETQHQSDCDGTLQDLFNDLVTTVSALP
jgi:hypothetical protein